MGLILDIAIKSFVGGLLIGIVSTIAHKTPSIGAFIMGIPFVSIITLLIMNYTGVPFDVVKTFSYQTVFFVALSLIFFPVFVALYSIGFYWALLISAGITGSIMWYFYEWVKV